MMTIKSATLPVRSSRIATIDFLRGLIMVIMALDHVRDFTHHEVFLYDPLDQCVVGISMGENQTDVFKE
jgi:uncharacterized membrane protein